VSQERVNAKAGSQKPPRGLTLVNRRTNPPCSDGRPFDSALCADKLTAPTENIATRIKCEILIHALMFSSSTQDRGNANSHQKAASSSVSAAQIHYRSLAEIDPYMTGFLNIDLSDRPDPKFLSMVTNEKAGRSHVGNSQHREKTLVSWLERGVFI
jgi:hypothetical protein